MHYKLVYRSSVFEFMVGAVRDSAHAATLRWLKTAYYISFPMSEFCLQAYCNDRET